MKASITTYLHLGGLPLENYKGGKRCESSRKTVASIEETEYIVESPGSINSLSCASIEA